MTREDCADKLTGALRSIGIAPGQTLMLGVNMGKLPLPRLEAPMTHEGIRQREAAWCEFLLRTIQDLVGPTGTLVVPTFSYSCNRDRPFILEETPAEVGPFTEYFRTRPGALRSLHPIFSVAAIGPAAESIISGVGGSAFGPSSPFGRLGRHDTQFLSLGVPFHYSVTYLHHLEQMHGCHHRYNKLLDIPVFAEGRKVDKPFLAYLRYRGLNCGTDFSPPEQRLRERGALRELAAEHGFLGQAVTLHDVDDICTAMLIEDPFAFATGPIRVDLDSVATLSQPNS